MLDRVRPTRLALVGAAMLVLLPVRAAEVVLQAVEDTWIDGLASTTTHGNDLALGICPVANYWMYFKFDVSNLGGTVTAAELRLARIDGTRPEEIALYGITDDTWSEATLNGPNRPAPTNPANASALARGSAQSGYDRWTSAALAATVGAEASGDGTLSLMAREDPAQMLDIRHYRSTEAAVPATQRPHLVVTCTTGEVAALVATASAPTTLAWSSGSAWDVAGGALADLHADGSVVAAVCLADALAVPSFVDPRPDPLAGQGYYYIVRAAGPCGTGTYGFATGGAERVPAAACP